ncbi:MAG: methyltransferase domain-containing protein, partial [Rhodobacteraceae bacterium]|nr:methyltransferase domain-containing protein [Paracoccaceae bacterium]
DNAFGAVLNVESAHCYPDRDAFFAEVFRVLAPGGTFHFSDFTRPGRDPAAEIAELTAALKEAGLTVATERDITDAILHGLDHDDARRRREIRRWFPLGTRRLAALWTGTRGSWIYEDFRAGRRKYVMVLAFKPAGSGNAALLAPACKAGHHHEPALTL